MKVLVCCHHQTLSVLGDACVLTLLLLQPVKWVINGAQSEQGQIRFRWLQKTVWTVSAKKKNGFEEESELNQNSPQSEHSQTKKNVVA